MTDLTNTELADRLRSALRDAPSWDSVPVSAALLAEAARRLREIGEVPKLPLRECGGNCYGRSFVEIDDERNVPRLIEIVQ